MNYLAYARDSGGDTQDLSVPQQIEAIHRWAAEHNATILHTYADEARPGSTTIGRAAFLDMIDRLRASTPAQITGLILWDWSRFGRAIDDSQYYRADLRRRGYTIHSINDPVPDNSIGRLFEAAIDWKNQAYLEDLSRNVRRGLANLLLNHKALGGTPPRGFMRQKINLGPRRDGTPHIVSCWVPDPALIPLVQQAFAMRAAGISYRKITNATHLYTNSPASWQHFFANKIYIGELHFGDLHIPEYCPPIIDPQTWQTVQQINSESLRSATPAQRRHPRAIESPYILTGLLYCARCGAPMIGNKTRRASYVNYYYDCSNRNRGHCDARQIPQIPIERAVLDALINHLLQPAILSQLQQDLNNHIQQTRAATTEEQHTALKTALADNRRKLNNLTLAIAEAGHSPALLQALAELENQQKSLQARLEALTTPYPIHTPTDLENIAAALRADLNSINQRATLQTCIHRITAERMPDHISGILSFTIPPALINSVSWLQNEPPARLDLHPRQQLTILLNPVKLRPL